MPWPTRSTRNRPGPRRPARRREPFPSRSLFSHRSDAMFQGISFSLNPIEPVWLLVSACLAVVILTLWAYGRKMRGTKGRWRWVALGLRLMAVLLCLLAALRPSVILQEKKRQAAALVFLIDTSTSMNMADEVR